MLHARQRRLEGKSRVRVLKVIQHNAALLAPAFAAEAEIELASGHRLQLQRLLEAVSIRAAEMASGAIRPTGRAPTPDAITFGSKALLAIWNAYSSRPANLSRQAGSFLPFGITALAMAISALGVQPAGLSRTTVANSLRKVVEAAATRKV